uniref:Ig-like domain-containing protein n=1 Tax=Panagrolaimus sp. PS1159 TaxID=55785 RepID=A0AC35FTV6_9BILA
MLSPSNSLEKFEEIEKPKISMSKTLEILDDLQLSNLINVVAEDFRLKCEMKAQLRQKELALSEYGYRHQGRNDGCAFCCQSFYMFHRSVTCQQCSRSICKNCCKEDKICNFCHDLQILNYRKREWSVLCPFLSNTFGYGKMVANDLENSHFIEWTIKAKLELHLVHLLADDLDSAVVCFTVTDNGLELIRRQLMMALLNYSNASHFAFIDDSILEAKKIIQKRSNCIQESKTPVESFSYFYLLSSAVISILVNAASPTKKYASLSKFHEIRPFFPTINDEDLQNIDYSGVTPYSLNSNWLLKPKFLSPRGSMRSQLSSHFVNSIVTPDFFKYGNSTEEKYMENYYSDADDLLLNVSSILDSESGYGTWKMSDTSKEYCPLTIQMQKQKIEAITGQFIKIKAKIICENLETIEILWYNQKQKIENGGRYRIKRERDETWLEIYDCNKFEDWGEIVCVGINDSDIVTDATILHIHEEDVAGEEPFFVEPLTLLCHKGSYISEGATIILKCRVIGYPQPYINFYCDNRLITDKSDDVEIEHFDDSWILRIGNCSPSDAGMYSALAVNRINKITSRFKVVVKTIYDTFEEGNKHKITMLADV